MQKNSRRNFLRHSGQVALGMGLLGFSTSLQHCGGSNGSERSLEESGEVDQPLFFSISLAQWSLHNDLFDGQIDNLDFPSEARNTYGIEAVEWVNQFFADKAEDMAYLSEMKKRCADAGVRSLLIMIDGEGDLGSTSAADRNQAVENHFKWVDAAKYLGCHSIRVNAAGNGTAAEVQQAAIEGLGRLAEYASSVEINVLVENHGGYSSNGQWLAGIMRQVDMPNCGTLPDFGNFCIEAGENGCLNMYDRYQGVRELMPFAKAVSAKTQDFNAEGEEVHTDYNEMMQIVKEAGYTGFVGIEYEGEGLSEKQGILRTKDLLLRVGRQLST